MLLRLAQQLKHRLLLGERDLEQRLLLRHGLGPLLLGSLLVTLAAGGVRYLGGLQRLEVAVYDHFTQWRLEDEPDPRLTVVGVTQADVNAHGRWPLADELLAQLLVNLQQHGPAAIGLDLYRDTPHPPGQEQLRQQLQRDNVYVVTQLDQTPPPVDAPPAQITFNDVAIDLDGVNRRQILMMTDEAGDWYSSLALCLALHYLEQRPACVHPDRPLDALGLEVSPTGLRFGDREFPRLQPHDGGYQHQDDGGFQILLDYQAGNDIAQQISLDSVLSQQVDPALIKDKIVLIGDTSTTSNDLFETPYSSGIKSNDFRMSGVVVHAQMVSQLLRPVLDDQPIFRFWPSGLEWLWAWGWALAGGGLAWGVKHPLSHSLMGLAALGSLAWLTWLLFVQAVWVPLVFPAIAFALASALLLAYKAFFRSFYDPLTGLPNRARFLQLLEQSMRRRRRSKLPAGEKEALAVMLLDLDRFKDVNESLGHQTGDRLLMAVSQRLQKNLPRRSKLARLGGDEFGILLSTVQGVEQTHQLADTLQYCLSQPLQLEDQELFTSASVGIALAPVQQRFEAEALLRDAHTATYRAKAAGQARHEVFSKGMRVEAVERFQLESDLRHALERQELYLLYQPFVDLRRSEVIGFEALVRWQHPSRGLVSPGEFIPVAETAGLIIPMGRWILRRACEQMVAWQGIFGGRSLVISVNLSGQQFTEPDLARQVEAILQETGLPPRSLKLELTESMMMGDLEAAIQTLLDLKRLKLQLGLDDFGTGYSSLSYLHRFPIDTLKIDMSFVRHMTEASENAAIVKTIVHLGHNLAMDVIAEGVEQADQAAALRALGCEYGQGYFFGKPLSAEAAEDLLRQQKTWLF